MLRVRVTAEAAQELEEAAAWYENQQPGLGAKLLDIFENAITLLASDLPPLTPMPGASGEQGAKRLLLHRFPFSLIAIEQGEEMIVLAPCSSCSSPRLLEGT